MNFRALSLSILLSSIVLPYAASQTAAPTLAASALTAVPPLVPYSGQVEGRTGQTSATFLIYKDQQGGEPLFTESQMISFDQAGHYKVQLGAANPNGLPPDLFSTGEARWLEVQIAGEPSQPRILLASVPYALKAADAATLGGLPASAFALAGSNTGIVNAIPAAITPDAASTVTTTGGTANKVAKFSGSNTIVNSSLYDNGTEVGIGTTTPTAPLTVVGNTALTGALTVNGDSTFNGPFVLPPPAIATASKGYNSQFIKLEGSAWNSSTNSAVSPRFQWVGEVGGNNTATPTITLNLQSSTTTAVPTETGFHFNANGTMQFAPGQTFPGTGKITSVGLSAPSSDFSVSGSPVTGAGTLGLNWKVPPTNANSANSIVKRDATGSFVAGAITANLGVQGTNSGGLGVYGTGLVGVAGHSNSTGADADGVQGTTASPYSAGVSGVNSGGGLGLFGAGGTGVFGSGSNYGFVTDSNVQQARTAGGWLKAMVEVDADTSSINRCFNSTLAGAAATTPPCGIDLEHPAIGHYDLNFNFEVDDRFYTTQILYDSTLALTLYRSGTNILSVWSYSNAAGDPGDADYQLIVY